MNPRPSARAVTPSRRSKGRPQLPDDLVGRETLVAATIKLLQTTPPAQLKLVDIARFASVDPALIRYYFGDLRGLLATAVAQLMGQFNARMAANVREADPASERLRQRILTTLGFLNENPYFHEIMVQHVDGGPDALSHAQVQAQALRGRAITQSILDQGARRGELSPADARFLQIAVVGLCEVFVTARGFVESVHDGRKVTQALVEQYGDFIVQLVLDGVRSKGSQARDVTPTKSALKRARER